GGAAISARHRPGYLPHGRGGTPGRAGTPAAAVRRLAADAVRGVPGRERRALRGAGRRAAVPTRPDPLRAVPEAGWGGRGGTARRRRGARGRPARRAAAPGGRGDLAGGRHPEAGPPDLPGRLGTTAPRGAADRRAGGRVAGGTPGRRADRGGHLLRRG